MHSAFVAHNAIQAGVAIFSSSEVATLAEFLSSRLTDWPCVLSAAAGCASLMQSALLLPREAAVIALAMNTSVQVQTLTQPERNACLKLWLALLQKHGCAVANLGVDLVDACLSAVDGEKDPRCLLLLFSIIQQLAIVYHAPGVDASPLKHNSGPIVETLSAYFPVTFTPPRNDAHRITRADLVAALQATLSASPFFAPFVLPLLLEKLSSTHRPAKLDALAALHCCCRAFGPEAMEPHSQLVWQGLRSELMAPAAYTLSGSELDSALELSHIAACCLTAAISCASPLLSLAAMVLRDSCVTDAVQAVVHGGLAATAGDAHAGSGTGSSGEAATHKLLCGARVLAAVAAASPAAFARAAEGPLLQLLSMVPAHPPTPTPVLDASTTVADTTAPAVGEAMGLGTDSNRLLSWLWMVHPLLREVATATSAATPSAPAAPPPPHGGAAAASAAPLTPTSQTGRGDAAWFATPALMDCVAAVSRALERAPIATQPPHPTSHVAGDAEQGRHAQALQPELQLACAYVWQDCLTILAAFLRHSTTDAASVRQAPAPAAESSATGVQLAAAVVAASSQQQQQQRLQRQQRLDPLLSAAAVQLTAFALPPPQPAAPPSDPSPSPDGSAIISSRQDWGKPADPQAVVLCALQSLLQLDLTLHRDTHPASGPRLAAAADPGGCLGPAGRAVLAGVVGHVKIRTHGAAAAGPARRRRAVRRVRGVPGGRGRGAVGVRGAAAGGRRGSGAAVAAPPQLQPATPAGQPLATHARSTQHPSHPSPSPDPTTPVQRLQQQAGRGPQPQRQQRAPGSAPSPAGTDVSMAGSDPCTALQLFRAALKASGQHSLSRQAPGASVADASGTGQRSAELPEALAAALCGCLLHVAATTDSFGQQDLAVNAADCLTRAAHSLATGTPSHHAASLASANQVSGFCCGVLLACRPAALTSASRSSVLESWLCLATHQPPLALDGPGGGAPGAGTAQEAWEEAAARSRALSAAAQGSAALAVAAAVNQWGGADQEGLDAVLGRVFGHCRAGAGSHRQQQASLLGWVARALAMTAHRSFPEALRSMVLMLQPSAPTSAPPPPPAPPPSDADTEMHDSSPAAAPTSAQLPNTTAATGSGGPSSTSAAASAAMMDMDSSAAMFEKLLSQDVCEAGGMRLWAGTHCLCRVLWQQRAWTLAIQALLPLLDGNADAGVARGSGGAGVAVAVAGAVAGQGARRQVADGALLAMAYLVKGAPDNILRQHTAQLAPHMLQSLLLLGRLLQPAGGVSEPGSASGRHAAGAAVGSDRDAAGSRRMARQRGLALTLLQLLSVQLADATTRKVFEPHVDVLMGVLLVMARLPLAGLVRETSLLCLLDMLQLPYHMLHPHRHKVLLCLNRCLDDDKRAVRRMATKARNAWQPR
ncbi:MAG: hypothetical protein WDW36_002378 [Sanguina aurantia]